MGLLQQFFRFHAKAARHHCLRGHGLFAGLLGYGYLIALPASRHVPPTVAWIVSSLLLATLGYLLRKNLWNDGREAFRIFGVSLIPLLVLAIILLISGNNDTEGFSFTPVFGFAALVLVPLWLPFGAGMWIAEIQSRRDRRWVESLRSPRRPDDPTADS